MKEIIQEQLRQAVQVLELFVNDQNAIKSIEQAATLMADALQRGSKIICCGNGGSLCDATHFAEELTARFRSNRRALAAISVNDPAFLTCAGNDFSFNEVFSRYVEAMGEPGDVLLAISTSGNSINVLEAAAKAGHQQMKVVALTGKDGGALAKIADVEIRAPYSEFSDRVQEIHIKVIHILVHLIEMKYGF